MGIIFGGSGHGPESSCQISAYINFFRGKSTSTEPLHNDVFEILYNISEQRGQEG